eukprot:gene35871-19787_t
MREPGSTPLLPLLLYDDGGVGFATSLFGHHLVATSLFGHHLVARSLFGHHLVARSLFGHHLVATSLFGHHLVATSLFGHHLVATSLFGHHLVATSLFGHHLVARSFVLLAFVESLVKVGGWGGTPFGVVVTEEQNCFDEGHLRRVTGNPNIH